MLVGIFGTGRNGSTLLMRLLDSSPDLWVYPLELAFLTSFGRLESRVSSRALRKLLKGSPLGTAEGRRQYYDAHFRRWVTSQLGELQATFVDKLESSLTAKDDVHQAMVARIADSVVENMTVFLDSVRAAYDGRAHSVGPFLAFKSIEVKRLEDYSRLFPDMRFVHILRDPVATYESLKRTDMVRKRKPFWFQGGDILRTQVEDRWLPHVRFILRHRTAEPERHYLVRYEDLTQDPTQVVNSLSLWLGAGIPVKPGLQTVLGGRTMAELPPNPSQEGVKTPARVVQNMASEFGYESVITRRETEWISFRTRGLAEQVGYANSSDMIDPRGRFSLLREWLPVDRWERMNAGSGRQVALHVMRRRCYLLRQLLFS